MESRTQHPPGIRSWTSAAALAVGLGAAPLSIALAPWPAWAALAAVLAIALVGAPAAAAEQTSARLDAEQSRGPLHPDSMPVAHGSAVLSTCLAGLATVHAAWAATALAQLAMRGSAATTAAGIGTWIGTDQGFLGVAGWQGSAVLLAAAGAVIALACVIQGGRLAGRLIVVLLACWLASTLALGGRLWLEGSAGLAALVDRHALMPAPDLAAARWFVAAILVGLLACGAGTGVVQAETARLGRVDEEGRRGRVLLPVAAVLMGLVALGPLGSATTAAPLLAPAPWGRQAALLLLVPPAALDGAGWQAAWFASLLAASLLGVLVASQPALRVLSQALGLGARSASAACGTLLALVAVPCLLLPGLREGLLVASGLVLLVLTVCLFTADWPPQPRIRLARGLALAAVGGATVLSGYELATGATAAWPDEALSGNRLLGLCLPLTLLLFWTALLAVAALRARRLRRPAPASPAAHRTRA